jgi:hypothetical protein
MDRLLREAALQQSDTELRETAIEIQQLEYDDIPVIRFGDFFGLNAVHAEVKGYVQWYAAPRFWGVTKEG